MIEFSLEAGSADKTLKTFCQKAHLRYSIDPAKYQDVVTHALHGAMTVDAGLAKLLENTGVTFELSADRTEVSFRRASPARTDDSTVRSREPVKPHAPETGAAIQEGTQEIPPEELSDVTVTGTMFHENWYPIGARVLTFDAVEFENSGYSSAGDFLRGLSQVFGGGATPDTHLGVEALTNTGLGSGINLRALGARATLLLVNGKRLAPSGSAGSFTDVYNIPLVAIDRIEVLPDSAAATYGSDAVGGVVNIITRNGLEAPLTFTQFNSVGRGSEHSISLYQTNTEQWKSGNFIFGIGGSHQTPLSALDRGFYTADLTYGGGPNLNLAESFPANLSNFAGTMNWALNGTNHPHPGLSDFSLGTVNLTNRYQNAQIIASQDNLNAYTKLFHQVGDILSISLDAFANRRRAAEVEGPQQIDLALSPGSPYYVNLQGDGSPLLLRTNVTDLLGSEGVVSVVTVYNISLDMVTALGDNRRLTVSANRGKERAIQLTSNSADTTVLQQAVQAPGEGLDFNPYDHTLDQAPALLSRIRGPRRFDSLSQLDSLSASLEDKVNSWPFDPLRWALGAELRSQLLASQRVDSSGSADSNVRYTRRIFAAFAEVTAPVFKIETERFDPIRLDTSVSVRQDDYSDFGYARTPRGGLQWTLGDRLTVRASYGHSFRAPERSDLDQSSNALLSLALPDKYSPVKQSLTLIESGNNSAIKQERGTEMTIGLNSHVPLSSETELEAALDYFAISLEGRIESTPFSDQLLNDNRYVTIVTRNPTSAELQAACATGRYLTAGVSCLSLHPAAIVDLRLRNLSALHTRGIDFDTSLKWASPWGNFSSRTNGTYLLQYAEVALPGATEVSLLNVDHNPINLRLRSSLDWQRGRVDVLVGANYTNRYRDLDSSPNRSVASFTTVDWQVKYAIGEPKKSGAFEVSVGMQNLFNRAPPFLRNVAGAVGYDQENADPLGLLWFVSCSYRY